MPTVPQSEQDRAQAMLATVRAETGFGPGQEPLPYIRTTAQRLGGQWGLNGKRGNPNDPSGDILAYDFPGQQPQLYDVLRDAGGANDPAWQPLEYPQSAGAVWLDPGDAPDPEPEPEPPSDDLEARVTMLEGQIERLAWNVASLEGRITALEQASGGSVPVYPMDCTLTGTFTGTLTPR